jgi:CheY-like chemotaxis protein
VAERVQTAEVKLMNHVLIVEDNHADVRQSAAILKKLHVSKVEAVTSAERALLHLQDATEGDKPAPQLVLLDLAFTGESGFEVLRYWKTHRDLLKNTHIVVWTAMGETEQQLCQYFGVDVVPKWAGPAELETVLRGYLSLPAQQPE